MRIRAKLIFVSIIASLLASAVMIAILFFLVTSSFADVEQSEMNSNLIRLENAVSNQFDGLASAAADWAIWDDAYNFLQTRDTDFIDREVSFDYAESVGSNLLTHATLAGEMIETRAVQDFADGEFDDELKQLIDSELSDLIPKKDNLVPWFGLLTVPDYPPLMLASSPVTMSDGSGEVFGTVIMGAFVTNESTAELSEDIQLDLHYWSVRNSSGEPDMIAAYQAIEAGEQPVIRIIESGQLSAYHLVRDIDDVPSYLLRLDMPRTAYLIGQKTIVMVMLGMIVLLLVFALGLYLIIGGLLTKRLELLSSAVKKIASGERPRVLTSGDDEISYLGQEITRTVAKLDRTTEKISNFADDLQKYKMAMEQVSESIIIADAEFKVLFANRVANALCSRKQDSREEDDALKIWSGDDAQAAENIRLGLVTGKTTMNLLVTIADCGNGILEMELTVSPVVDDAGALKYFVGVMRDVTKQKEIDRMKSEFVSIASHQLKAPLSSIRWLSETVMEGGSGMSDEQREYLAQLYSVNERLIRLVNDLLNVSRIETGNNFSFDKKSVDLITLIHRVVADQAIVASQKKIDINLAEGAPETLTSNIDEQKIGQVLNNLINNAVKYSPNGETVTIDVADGATEILISISDHGIGMPAGEHEKIFDKFFRASNVGETEGTGLGLFIVKAIVEGHGGKIWFDSKEGAGTDFRFTLPK